MFDSLKKVFRKGEVPQVAVEPQESVNDETTDEYSIYFPVDKQNEIISRVVSNTRSLNNNDTFDYQVGYDGTIYQCFSLNNGSPVTIDIPFYDLRKKKFVIPENINVSVGVVLGDPTVSFSSECKGSVKTIPVHQLYRANPIEKVDPDVLVRHPDVVATILVIQGRLNRTIEKMGELKQTYLTYCELVEKLPRLITDEMIRIWTPTQVDYFNIINSIRLTKHQKIDAWQDAVANVSQLPWHFRSRHGLLGVVENPELHYGRILMDTIIYGPTGEKHILDHLATIFSEFTGVPTPEPLSEYVSLGTLVFDKHRKVDNTMVNWNEMPQVSSLTTWLPDGHYDIYIKRTDIPDIPSTDDGESK